MLRSSRVAAIFAVVSLAVALNAAPGAAAEMRWGAQVFGGWDTHSMDDWNTAIDQANSFGSNYDNIKNGLAFGGGPVVTVDDRWQFGAHFERLMAKKSEDAGTEVKPVANAMGVTAGYLFPSNSPMNFGLFASVDYMSLAGTLSDPSTSNDIKGSGVGFLFGGNTNYAFSPTMGGNVSLGYRVADIGVDTIGGQDASGSGLDTENYSGLAARVGFTFHQARK